MKRFEIFSSFNREEVRFLSAPLPKTRQATRNQEHYNVNLFCMLLATPWSMYNYKALAIFKSMVFLISGLFKNHFCFEKGGGGHLRMLNHIIKQSCNITEHYLIFWEG